MAEKKKEARDYRIAILQRGWVFVGRFAQDGERCFLRDASCVRYWGTTRGIGQLALEGPLSATKLDPAGEVEFHTLTAVALLKCREDAWTKHFGAA